MSKHQIVKRTVLSDSLELELMKRSPNPTWRFKVRETTCTREKCDRELIAILWFGHSFVGKACDESDSCSEVLAPLTKTWYAEEVRRRKSIGDFAQAVLNRLVKLSSEDARIE